MKRLIDDIFINKLIDNKWGELEHPGLIKSSIISSTLNKWLKNINE